MPAYPVAAARELSSPPSLSGAPLLAPTTENEYLFSRQHHAAHVKLATVIGVSGGQVGNW